MKRNCFKTRILTLTVCCIFLLNGCRREEITFTDVQTTIQECCLEETASRQEISDEEKVTVEREEPLVVHVCGAVVSPGVYELPAGSRIVDAVDMAGGLREDAEDTYVNLADTPSDGEQIFIPTKEEAKHLKQVSQMTTENPGKVNINTADKELLCTLPGIGDTRAESIIAYRQQNGLFASIEDIMMVSGIKESSFQKIKELITVN